jgi:hypothetical protein
MRTQRGIPAGLGLAVVVFTTLVLPTAVGAQAYVPFKVQINGGLCDSGPSPSSNPSITIDNDSVFTFMVTSIIIKRGPMNPVDFTFLSVNSVSIDGTLFDTRTANLFGPIGGEFGVLQSADIMGMPVRQTSFTSRPGGNVPHTIVADGAGAGDIVVRLFCRSDNRSMNIATILVAGWKVPGSTVTVSYTPGS